MLDAAIEYQALLQQKLNLDLSRGKPSPQQLDLSMAMLSRQILEDCLARDGMDCRNYGGIAGIPEARQLFGDLLGAPAAQTIVSGCATLELLHDVLVYALFHGWPGFKPWKDTPDLAFIAPVPGYDRHFALCQRYGIRLYPVQMNADGPDMDQVEHWVAQDASIKGMWCVPRYNNPTGVSYSNATLLRLAQMPTAAADFRLLVDDAYRFHHLTAQPQAQLNVLQACAAAGYPERALVFTSTSKITFANAGVAAMAAGPETVAWWQSHAQIRSIGPDKINQLRHVRFLRDRTHLEALMRQHAALLRPRFAAIYTAFATHLADMPGVSWTQPEGGYFVNVRVPPGTASRVVALARAAGVVLTPAGSSFPAGDPRDEYLRLAPSFPAVEQVAAAARAVAICIRLANCTVPPTIAKIGAEF